MDGIIERKLMPRLTELFALGEKKITLPLLRVLGNMCSGADQHTQMVLDSGMMDVVADVITEGSQNNLLKEALFILSNIAAGTVSQIQVILDFPQLLGKTVKALIKGDTSLIKHEAGWVALNILQGGNTDQKATLLGSGAVQATCVVLKNNHQSDDANARKLHTCCLRILKCAVAIRPEVVVNTVDTMSIRQVIGDLCDNLQMSNFLPDDN